MPSGQSANNRAAARPARTPAKIPMPFAQICVRAAVAGGRAAAKDLGSVADGVCKDDGIVGERQIATVTQYDYHSQAALLPPLIRCRSALLLTEEHIQDDRIRERLILDRECLRRLAAAEAFVVDELDGSFARKRGHDEWCVAIGYMRNLAVSAGAIFAPSIERGILYFAEHGKGAFIKKGTTSAKRISVSQCNDISRALLLFGPDCCLPVYPPTDKLRDLCAHTKNTVVSSSLSAALAMGRVACGAADAVIQPCHAPWDWCAGKIIVEEAGGKLIFFEMPEIAGDPMRRRCLGERVDVPRLEHYDPTRKLLGFIAAPPVLAEELFKMLSQKRHS